MQEPLRDKLDLKPDVLFVDDPQTLNRDTWGEVAVCCFQKPETGGQARKLCQVQFWIDTDQPEKADAILQLLEKHVPDTADLKEPLHRVEQALKEALGQAA